MVDNTFALAIDEGFVFVLGLTETRELVVSLNTGEGTQFGQLWTGIDSEGRDLASIGGGYSPITEFIKMRNGQPIDRVTLYDTGEFYQTFKARPVDGGLLIEADTMKEGEDLQARWGDKLLGLTVENMGRLANAMQPQILEWLKTQMLK